MPNNLYFPIFYNNNLAANESIILSTISSQIEVFDFSFKSTENQHNVEDWTLRKKMVLKEREGLIHYIHSLNA
jgi:hypothetical protein